MAHTRTPSPDTSGPGPSIRPARSHQKLPQNSTFSETPHVPPHSQGAADPTQCQKGAARPHVTRGSVRNSLTHHIPHRLAHLHAPGCKIRRKRNVSDTDDHKQGTQTLKHELRTGYPVCRPLKHSIHDVRSTRGLGLWG